MRFIHQLPQLLLRAKPLIDIQEILHAVPMVRLQLAHLLEHRAQPDRRHAQPLQVAEFRLDAGQRAADEFGARVEPVCRAGAVGDGVAGVAGLEEWCLAGGDGGAGVGCELGFVVVGEAVTEEEIAM